MVSLPNNVKLVEFCKLFLILLRPLVQEPIHDLSLTFRRQSFLSQVNLCICISFWMIPRELYNIHKHFTPNGSIKCEAIGNTIANLHQSCALVHPIQWTITDPVGTNWPIKRQKKSSCVTTNRSVPHCAFTGCHLLLPSCLDSLTSCKLTNESDHCP